MPAVHPPPKRQRRSLFSSPSLSPSVVFPPIRLNIEEVEKSLQDECYREMAKQQQQQQLQQPQQNSLQLDSLFKISAKTGALPFFPSIRQSSSPSPTQKNPSSSLTLKRFQRSPLYDTDTTTTRSILPNAPDIVLDIPSFYSSYRQFQQWTPAVNDQPNSQELHGYVEDILEEVLGETDYSSRNRIIALPSVTPSASDNAASTAMDTTSPVTSATAATTTTSTDTATPAIDTTTIDTATPAIDTTASTITTTTDTTTPAIDTTASTITTTTNTSTIAIDTTTTTTTVTDTMITALEESMPSVQQQLTDDTTATTVTDTMTTALEAPMSSAQPFTDATTSSSSQNNNIVPVFATDFQLRAVENEIGRLHGNFSSQSSLKNRIGKIIDIFNHPLHAMIPGYSSSKDDGVWRGSGKTLFLQQLTAQLEHQEQDFNLAIICYDLNMEGFLLDLFKTKYPVTRLNTIIKGCWQKEHGVVLCIRKKYSEQQSMHLQQSSFTNKVHLVISSDLRIQPNDPIVTLFENALENAHHLPPPVILLSTVGSVEERLTDFSQSLIPTAWQIPDQASCPTIFDTSGDKPVDHPQSLTDMVVDSVVRWIRADSTLPFSLGLDQQEDEEENMEEYDEEQPSPLPRSESPQTQPQALASPQQEPTLLALQQENQVQPSQPQPDTIEETMDTHSMMDMDHDPGAPIGIEELPQQPPSPTSTTLPKVQRDDFVKLFSHASLEALANNLKTYQSSHSRSSKEHFTTTSDDDSFYSAESESLPLDDPAATSVHQVMEKINSHQEEADDVRLANTLKSLKLDFDKQCLDLFESMMARYQTEVGNLQQDYVKQAELLLAKNTSSP